MTITTTPDIHITDLARDYLGLDSLFTTEELAQRDTVREYVDRRIRPNIATWFEDAHFPVEIAGELGELGLLGMHLAGYGCPGRSAIHKYGSEAQKRRWLPGMATGELIGCFGLTEPTAGSDPAGMATVAVRDGNDWVINGAKRWIGLASIAHVAVVWARTEEGIRGFLVPTDTPGFTATPIAPKLSLRASIQCDVELAGVRVPADAALPDVTGLKGPFSCLNEARYGILRGAMGAARDSYEAALRHSLDPSRSPARHGHRWAATASPWITLRCGTPPTWSPCGPTKAPTKSTR